MTTRPYHRQNLAAAIRQRARQELEEAGVADLSLRQLARFLDVTPAAIYRHFPNKASLLHQLRVDILNEVAATLREGVLDSPVAATMLTRMVTNLLTYQRDHPQAVAFVVTGAWPVPDSLVTVITLWLTQTDTQGEARAASKTVWTFLLGVLLCQPQRPVTADLVTHQLTKLLGAS
ncbi:TetR/AcrR family transcriptional regulator [Levilactobacillus suantsaii]|uniref:TetR/AcrR family transcriptional regulator n=1 Tax=Levilactobacillus suantsaii TaxID=2292255 RepID=A0A4Q0VIK4_9LACO|nr:TetR/AcrR family transcriptional regulator [Levilactobacillus suantsaii]QMU07690.1 TetR/AcrR family transcriptional regulator [Levilactobacillus suantsaii]RXI78671.1 TetR/AcrR family transcriptional regulator [Levilactobacillus suantsaii]